MKKTVFLSTFALLALVISFGCEQETEQVGPRSSPDAEQARRDAVVADNRHLAPQTLNGSRNDLTPVTPPDKKPSQNSTVTPHPNSQRIVPGVMHASAGDIHPGPPKADETVSGSYRSNGSSVEVEGVCRVTEDSVECWKPDGSGNEELTRKITAGIEKQQSYSRGMGPSFNFQYGRKNRLIVFKLTRPNGAVGGGLVSIQSVGPYGYGGGSYGFNLDEPRMFNNNQPVYIRYETRTVTEDKEATKTTARLTEFTPILDRPTLENKVGASVTFGGESHTIVSIKKGIQGQPFYGNPEERNRPAWTLVLRSTHSSRRPISVSITAQNAAGQTISYVDEKGDPISDEAYRDRMMTYQRKMEDNYRQGIRSQASFPHFSPAVAYTSSKDGDMIVILRVDPSKIAKFSLGGGSTKFIDLTDIPLGPH